MVDGAGPSCQKRVAAIPTLFMCCSPSSLVCQVCGKDDVGMCGARYDVAPLTAVVSEPLHKQLVCVMVRDPLSPVYENKQTVKGFTCSETTAKRSVELERRRPKPFSSALTHLPILPPPFSLQPLWPHGALHSTINILKVIIS